VASVCANQFCSINYHNKYYYIKLRTSLDIVFVPFDEIKESQNRLLAIIEIEHDVNLIKEMFLELNSMIEEQSIPIQTIVVQIEEAKESSKVANDHVEKIDEYRQGFKSKITKIIMFSVSCVIFIKILNTII
jgi:t-SNARE complex subunit (syntaxin)